MTIEEKELEDICRDCALLIFVKNPVPGKVKTRLAKTVGDKKAFDIYKKLMSITRIEAEKTVAVKKVWYSSYIDRNDEWNENDFQKDLQPGGNLGDKMSYAFLQAFNSGFEKVVIIGSDCPEITADLIHEAFSKLKKVDAVVGPSRDGGYYLLGMREFIPSLFKKKSWSTENVLQETFDELKRKRKTFSTLITLNDIDNEQDLKESKLSA